MSLMHGNVPAVCAVAAASRWHVFLQVCGGLGLCFSLQIYRVGKNRDTRREYPAVTGPAGWFLPGGFSRNAGPIKHQLVLVCRSGGSARKNQSKAIAYTDLLGVVLYSINFSISAFNLGR